MPSLFSSTPGLVALVGWQNGLPSFLSAGGLESMVNVLLTGLAVQAEDGHQINHSLNDFLYIYSFSQRATEVTAQGLAFAGSCAENPAADTAMSGLENLYSWFESYRLSNSGWPLYVGLGRWMTLSGFLTKFNYQVIDPGMLLGQFTAQLRCPPQASYWFGP